MSILALVDCNNFFASCERAFNPKLRKKPIVVLSNNDGCVVARSNEAKALGIPMGAPYFEWKDVCKLNKVHVFSSNYILYGDMSARVMTLIQDFCPDIEVYSIDEAFLKFHPNEEASLFNRMKKMRSFILQSTGIPVSIGIAPTKTLTKIAGDIAKKNSGVFMFSSQDKESWREILSNLSVEDIWGIGKQLSTKLKLMGIRTVEQLRTYHAASLRQRFGVVMERIVLELNGIRCLELDEYEPRKSIMSSKSFSTPVRELRELKEAINHFSAQACIKLREQGSKTYQILSYVRTHPFIGGKECQRIVTLQEPTNDTRIIMNIASKCAESMFIPGIQYRKAGVLLLNLLDETLDQFSLFPSPTLKSDKGEKLMSLLDSVNSRFGKNSIYFAAQGVQRNWQMRSDHISKRYTTSWSDLLNAV